MYKMSDEFFQSLGMWKMTQKFWDNSVIEKKEGVEMVCHASAWDFMDGPGISDDGSTSDYRIKQCTSKDSDYFWCFNIFDFKIITQKRRTRILSPSITKWGILSTFNSTLISPLFSALVQIQVSTKLLVTLLL